MKKDQKKAIDTIADSIKNTCERLLMNAGYDKTFSATVLKSNDTKNDFYDVIVEGNVRTVKNGTPMTFDPSCPVWCLAPLGDLTNMFIVARR